VLSCVVLSCVVLSFLVFSCVVLSCLVLPLMPAEAATIIKCLCCWSYWLFVVGAVKTPAEFLSDRSLLSLPWLILSCLMLSCLSCLCLCLGICLCFVFVLSLSWCKKLGCEYLSSSLILSRNFKSGKKAQESHIDALVQLQANRLA
jgi:hypothetical protein